MKLESIQKLIKQGESQKLEFKKSTSQLKPTLETLCGFLNSQGGTVLIGITDQGKIIGQQVHDKTQKEIAQALAKLEPKPSIDVAYIDVGDDKQVIVLTAPAGNHAPYTFDGRPYERNQSTTERMSQHRYEQLIVKRSQLNHQWDAFPVDGFTIDDLDTDEIFRTIKEGVDKGRIDARAIQYDIPQILRNFGLLEHGELNHAAMVLFTKDPQRIYSRCMLRLARFRGTDKTGDFIDNQRVTGHAFELIGAGIEFALRYLPIAGHFDPQSLRRIDTPAVPQLALREALINAICHRDYSVYNSTIGLAIYDDRLELWNVGELPSELTFKKLRQPHDSYPRNPKIAEVFYKRGWIESWGTGTLRIIQYCQDNKTPEPEFIHYSGGFAIVFPFKEPMHQASADKISIDVELNTRQQAIIVALQEGGKSTKQLMEYIKEDISERWLRQSLSSLKKLGLISSTGRTKSTMWFLIGKNKK